MRALQWAALCVAALCAAARAAPVALNPNTPGFAFDPALAAHPDGSVTVVWDSYDRSRERVFQATVRAGQVSRAQLLSPGEGVLYQPVVISNGSHRGWAFWTERRDGAWRVVGRRLHAGTWEPAVTLAEQALAPAAVSDGDRAALAWEDHSTFPESIRMRLWDGRRWGPSETVAAAGYRPALAAAAGTVWIAWDAYDRRDYAVYARRLSPSRTEPARLSAAGKSCLKPAVAIAGGRAAVAWVATAEVAGATGVLDHWDTLQIAFEQDGRWSAPAEAADLRYGLLPRIEPAPDHMSGYSGRRRRPMLAVRDGALWLLWERKAVHDGRSDTPGQLCGLRYRGTMPSAPSILHQGLVDYRLESGGKPIVAAKDTRHVYSVFELDLAGGGKFSNESWTGWKPVTLPLRADPPRPAIERDGRRYQLYWGDLHVHSVLTPDAEGEPDELLHFARDKARLDVVVMQENDANSWMKKAYRNHLLSQAEYELSTYLSRRYTENGRFVALPGWEWSHRTADDDKPNHRTVIFPGAAAPILRHPENAGDFTELCDAVEAAGGLMNTQHEIYRLVDRPCDANIEVASGWNVFIRDPRKIHADLTAGYRVGFVATGDAHRRNPGLVEDSPASGRPG
jgi:hypothetical protein